MPEDIILSSSHSFQITIEGITDENEYFYSIDGLEMNYQTKSYLSGCENNVFLMINGLETSPLIVKRPLSNVKSGFSNWCMKLLDSSVFEPVSMNIFILNHDNSINNHWIAEGVYPTGIKTSTINIENKNPVIMEIITLMYRTLKRVK